MAFVLHSYPHRESSLVVELFTRAYGRVAAVARGARRPRSALRAVLLQFQPLHCSLVGQGELRTLAQAEWTGGVPMPAGRQLLNAFYCNELLMRMLIRDDPHPPLFDGYRQAIQALGDLEDRAGAGSAREDTETVLRRFEWLLLQQTGYAPDLSSDRDGRPLSPEQHYGLVEGQWVVLPSAPAQTAPAASIGGPVAASTVHEPQSLPRVQSRSPRSLVGPELPSVRDAFPGQVLREMGAGRYDAPLVLQAAKRLTRALLAGHLQGAPLRTRQILLDLQSMKPHD